MQAAASQCRLKVRGVRSGSNNYIDTPPGSGQYPLLGGPQTQGIFYPAVVLQSFKLCHEFEFVQLYIGNWDGFQCSDPTPDWMHFRKFGSKIPLPSVAMLCNTHQRPELAETRQNLHPPGETSWYFYLST